MSNTADKSPNVQLVPPMLLRPGVAFMRRFGMRTKLSLIAAVLIIPLLVAVTLLGLRLLSSFHGKYAGYSNLSFLKIS